MVCEDLSTSLLICFICCFFVLFVQVVMLMGCKEQLKATTGKVRHVMRVGSKNWTIFYSKGQFVYGRKVFCRLGCLTSTRVKRRGR